MVLFTSVQPKHTRDLHAISGSRGGALSVETLMRRSRRQTEEGMHEHAQARVAFGTCIRSV
jgi:hypothetical protein